MSSLKFASKQEKTCYDTTLPIKRNYSPLKLHKVAIKQIQDVLCTTRYFATVAPICRLPNNCQKLPELWSGLGDLLTLSNVLRFHHFTPKKLREGSTAYTTRIRERLHLLFTLFVVKIPRYSCDLCYICSSTAS